MGEVFLGIALVGIGALIFAVYLADKVKRQDAGTEKMQEIAAAIEEGARAFLKAEYKMLVIFVTVLFYKLSFK